MHQAVFRYLNRGFGQRSPSHPALFLRSRERSRGIAVNLRDCVKSGQVREAIPAFAGMTRYQGEKWSAGVSASVAVEAVIPAKAGTAPLS